jgi:hypothetical protein
MPNQYQVTFLLSFATIFGLLAGGSLYAFNKLRAAGYDPVDLYLYGLPKREPAQMSVAGVNVTQLITEYPTASAWLAGIVALSIWYVNFGMKRECIPSVSYVVATRR